LRLFKRAGDYMGFAKKRIEVHKIVLLGVLAFALILRVYRLDKIPSGFYCDEAATGYGAYSLLKTGRDPYGNFLPLLLNHHNIDYVEALYTYLTVPFISLFGLSVFSTRLLASLTGTLTVLTTYLLARELFNREVGLVSAFLLAVSPWHLQFSRIAFRAILLPLFSTSGLYLFLLALKRPRFYLPTAIVLGLSLHTYSISKLYTPLLLVTLILFFREELVDQLASSKRSRRYICVSSIVFLLLALPIYYLSFFGEGNMRFKEISIFATPGLQEQLKRFLSNLAAHLSPRFLFISGDENLRHSIPHFGQVLAILIPFIMIALYMFIYKKDRRGCFLISLFIIGIIPASLTTEGIPHAMRTISAVPILEIISAFGICSLHNHWRGNRNKKILFSVVILLLFLNILFFLNTYFIKYPPISEDWFQYGLGEAIAYTESHSIYYDNIILTSKINQPYIFPLFFARLDPVEFQKSRKLGKYLVCPEEIDHCYGYEGRNLFIALPNELPGGEAMKHIYNSKGEVVLKIVE